MLDQIEVRGPSAPERSSTRSIAAVVAVGALVLATHLWGQALRRRGVDIFLPWPPLLGFARPFPVAIVLPAVLGAGGVAWGPALAARLTWRHLLWVSTLAAVSWSLALAVTDGFHAVAVPLTRQTEYLHDLPLVHSPASFLHHFVERIDAYTTHVRAHPPGFLLLLWAMRRVGLDGSGWAATLVIGGGAALVPATLITLRDVAGEDRARRAAPFLVLAPLAVWVATSVDAFIAGVATWAVTLVVVATARRDRRGDLAATGGGLLFGAAAFLSYGAVGLVVVPILVGLWRRRVRPLLLAGCGTAVVVLVFAANGFSWFDGLGATRREYQESIARTRPFSYFVVANLAAFAIVLGPATIAGLAQLRARSVWILVAGGVVCVLAADLSGLSKGEVERIWLPFAPWLLVATCALPTNVASRRRWLGGQVLVALALQSFLGFPW